MSTTETIFVLSITAMGLVLSTTPWIERLARNIGFFDQTPESGVPLLGGIALFLGVMLSILLFGQDYLYELAAILIGAACISLLGLFDDRQPLSARSKFGGQVVIVLGVWFSGVDVHLGWLSDGANVVLTFFWILGITNATNLLDNMDGLCGGISAIAAGFILALAALNGQYMVASLAGAVMGSCVGFLFFNRKPARLYMGDSGSLFLGLLLAVMSLKLRFPDNISQVTWMVPLLILAIPILDTTLVTISRLRRGRNPFTTRGKDHSSHRLSRWMNSDPAAVRTLYALSMLFGIAGAVVSFCSPTPAHLIGGTALGLFILLLIRLEQHPGKDGA